MRPEIGLMRIHVSANPSVARTSKPHLKTADDGSSLEITHRKHKEKQPYGQSQSRSSVA
jgi:hypothetical protein